MPLHSFAWLYFRSVAAADGLTAADLVVFDRFMAIWTSAVTVALAFSARPALAGRDAPWTGYVFTVLWVLPPIALSEAFMDISVLTYFPALMLFVMLFFDERFAAAGVLCLMVAFLAGAPIFESIDLVGLLFGWTDAIFVTGAHPPAIAFAIAAVNTIQFQIFIVIVMMSAIAAAARRLQESRLAQAERGLRESSEALQRANHLIKRYVPGQLVDRILAGEHHEDSKPERRKLTIFFSDVQGFTDASDELDPEELATLLNEYLSEMTTIADRYGATVNQLVGDGIMIFFGAPAATDDRDHALRAVRMGLEMQARMRELRAAWFRRGIQRPFHTRIGIHTGFASVGDYGSPGRKLYSAIGLQTNLAARIQARCEPGRVMISHPTWALVHDEIPSTDRGELQFKGVHYPLRVYDVTDPSEPASTAAAER